MAPPCTLICLGAPPAAHLVFTRLRNFVNRCGEFCVCKLIVSTNAGQIGTIQTRIITKPVTSPSKLSGHMSHPPPLSEILALKHESKILGQWSNSGAGFNGRVNEFTCVDSARPVADQ